MKGGPALHYSVDLRNTDTNKHGTCSVKIWNTRMSVDIRFFFSLAIFTDRVGRELLKQSVSFVCSSVRPFVHLFSLLSL